ncbi:MAG: hypothetical protein ABI806_16015 [Candidatus Solibacter sp.]
MKLTRENAATLALLVVVLALNAWGLRAELNAGGVDLNDNVSHFRMIAGMSEALQRGGNPLDFWSPEWSFGFPLVRVYQPLAHLLVVLVYFAMGKAVSLVTVLVWFRFLALALLPLSVFAMTRGFGLPPLTAAAAVCLAPLISTPQLYGLEYESYVWAGFGLFPQAVAVHFLLLALGCAHRAVRGAGSATLAGVLLGLTFLCQIIYGYIGAISICLLALLAVSTPRIERVKRILWIGTAAFALSLFQLLPLWLDRALINPTPADQVWKSDSFGPSQVLEWLVTGQLLDHGRLPILSLLALAGVAALCFKPREMGLTGKFALAGMALWLLIFMGRPLWGPLLYLLGITPDFHLHRVLAGAQIFLLVLAATGLAAFCEQLARRVHIAAAAVAALALSYPMVAERLQYLDLNRTRMQRSIQAMQTDRPALDALIDALRQRGGRAFAGLATANSWGPSFRVGAVPMYHVLASAGVPTVGYLSHTMALTSGIMLDFDERNPVHYSLFDIRAFIVPAGTKYPVPAFLKPGTIFGRFQIFDTPSNGAFDVVDAGAGIFVTRDDFLAVNDSWLKSSAVLDRMHLQLASPGAPATAGAALPLGEIASAREDHAEFDTARPAWALFKSTWHPNWKATLDGKSVSTAMLSPGFIGIPVPAGHHALSMQYRPGAWKLWLALVGALVAIGLAFAERKLNEGK